MLVPEGIRGDNWQGLHGHGGWCGGMCELARAFDGKGKKREEKQKAKGERRKRKRKQTDLKIGTRESKTWRDRGRNPVTSISAFCYDDIVRSDKCDSGRGGKRNSVVSHSDSGIWSPGLSLSFLISLVFCFIHRYGA